MFFVLSVVAVVAPHIRSYALNEIAWLFSLIYEYKQGKF